MVKTKKKNLSEFAQQKRAQKNKKQLNPFEVHINRDKQKVLGQKKKKDYGLPGISRAKAINKRKQSLLQEYKIENKDNVFLDKRIGEKDFAMSMEDKGTALSTAGLMKVYKKKNNIYKLDDVMTHGNQTLEAIEKFDDPRSDDEFSDEETNGQLDKNFVASAHFGGLFKPDFASSRKDLIDQLIVENKKRKAERQKIREQTIDLTEKLDSEWRDVVPLMSVCKKSNEDIVKTAQADAYDMAVRELQFERRGNPSEKLKSEEEIIKAEKEKLEVLEADRLARMKGFTSNANERKHRSADDLDNFLIETVVKEADDSNEEDSDVDNDEISDNSDDINGDKYGTSTLEIGKDSISTRDSKSSKRDQDRTCSESSNAKDKFDVESNNKNAADEGSDSENSEDNFSDLRESESSSEDENEAVEKHVMFSDNLTKDTNQSKQTNVECSKSILKQSKVAMSTHNSLDKDKQQEIRNDLFKRKEIMEKAREELPYTYTVPENFEELEKFLENHNSEYQSIIIDRIIKCNHWTSNEKNKEKLSNLFVYLLQHICNCVSTSDADDLVKCFQVFDQLCPYLYDLAHMNPENAKICIEKAIREKHDEFVKNRRKYPDMDTLIFFKLVSLLFPTSDFRHSIVTPCLVFMSQILIKSRIKNRSDISKGLFICTLILEYTVLSKRFAPSAINFLRGIVYASTPEAPIQKMKVIPPFKKECNFLVVSEKLTDIEIDLNGANMTANDLMHEELDNEFRIRALITAVNLIREFKNQLQGLEVVYLIFEPIFKLLKINKFKQYPLKVKYHIKELCEEIEALQNKKWEPMVLEKKIKSLRLYEPRIMTIYDRKQHKPMSKEKADREKLLYKHKKEMKGAIRELRRDNTFLAKVQISQQIKNDAERKRKVKEIFGEAAMQQSELKKMKKKK